ncbi:MAG: hypothetical protein WD845_10150 [Pirellulales bacterium]
MERIRVRGVIADDTGAIRGQYIGQLAERIATKRLAIEAMRWHYANDFGAQPADRERVLAKLDDDVAELEKLLDDARCDHHAKG